VFALTYPSLNDYCFRLAAVLAPSTVIDVPNAHHKKRISASESGFGHARIRNAAINMTANVVTLRTESTFV
jgi:hypothetical protein